MGQINTELERRIRRLLNGERNPRDLERILLAIRGKTRRNRLLKDLADFVAHPDLREQGHTWSWVNNASKVYHFQVHRADLELDKKPLLDKEIQSTALRAALDLVPPSLSRSIIGIEHNQAVRVLRDFINRNMASGFAPELRPTLFKNQREATLISFLLADGFLPRAVNSSVLSRELIVVLQKEMGERFAVDASDRIEEFVGLFAVERMHLAKVKGVEGQNFDLFAGYQKKGGRLQVRTSARFPFEETKSITVDFPVFSTDCMVSDHCSQRLFQVPSGEVVHSRCALEINDHGKLDMID